MWTWECYIRVEFIEMPLEDVDPGKSASAFTGIWSVLCFSRVVIESSLVDKLRAALDADDLCEIIHGAMYDIRSFESDLRLEGIVCCCKSTCS